MTKAKMQAATIIAWLALALSFLDTERSDQWLGLAVGVAAATGVELPTLPPRRDKGTPHERNADLPRYK